MQARFKEHLQLFFEAVSKQAQDQDDGVILDAESYIAVRRNLGACKVFFDMVEYAYKIDLPEFVVEHPIIKALNDGANDAICLANVCFYLFSCPSFPIHRPCFLLPLFII